MNLKVDEKHQSQIPALFLMASIGYTPLSQEKCLHLRRDRLRNVLLEDILIEQMLKTNEFKHRGKIHKFNLEDAHLAIKRLTPASDRKIGLRGTNQAIYDSLVLGTTITKTIDGESKSYSFRYIDWENIDNNVYHVTFEMEVESANGVQVRRPDIVAFVNGIPFLVIENKKPTVSLKKAQTQLISYQTQENIPYLFHFAQLLMVMNRGSSYYATVGTRWNFWQTWKEHSDIDKVVKELINQPINSITEQAIFSGPFADTKNYFSDVVVKGRETTEQDRAIYSLCRPDRLLDLVRRFTVFEQGDRKIARYPQYFGVLAALQRVRQFNIDSRRKGGVIWHTQGSGKSLTMVMFARALAMEKDFINPRILIVTDREDLDRQIKDTFKSCEMELVRATAGKHLVSLIQDKTSLITTIVNKFDTALKGSGEFVDADSNLFVLVDESHRTQSGQYGGYGQLAKSMRRMLPNACYIGFTGTPLLKSEQSDKDTFSIFGDLIHKYSINDAVNDEAVVPLYYEGRLVEQNIASEGLDAWFEMIGRGLTEKQQADLKEKYSRINALSQTTQTIYTKAYDISEHYRQSYKDTPFKAQLVAPSKAAAIRFKNALDDIGHVSSEVIISAPSEHEGHEDVDSESKDLVTKFWTEKVGKYTSEHEYNQEVIDNFKNSTNPEILIVVSKLLTGFDAPRNTVLYICKPLRGHSLLQAIARVNRLYQDSDTRDNIKKYGLIVDYEGLLGELDDALTSYDSLQDYDAQDIVNAVRDFRKEIEKLPELHGALWDVFKSVKNKNDMEELEQFLHDESIRQKFYDRFRIYSRCLHISLCSEKFHEKFSQSQIDKFSNDWKFFSELRKSVRIRYQEVVDIAVYEPKIRKLLDDHVTALPPDVIIEPVNIHDSSAFEAIVKETGVSEASKADRIASATKRTITERMDEDPAFYRTFSELIEETIRAYRERRLSEREYLDKVMGIAKTVGNREHRRDVPESLFGNTDGQAFYGILTETTNSEDNEKVSEVLLADSSLKIVEIITGNLVVDFWANENAIKNLKIEIDDYIYDELIDNKGIVLTTEQFDELERKILKLAQARFPE